jgi:hypothetical protein
MVYWNIYLKKIFDGRSSLSGPGTLPMSDDTAAGAVHVEVYVRSLPTHGRTANAVLGRLSTLEKRGLIDVYEVLVWGDRAPTSPAAAETPTGREIAERVALFREWARRNDVSLGPAMRARTVESTLRDEAYDEVRLPEVLVATYCGEDLAAVTPHRQDEQVCTVQLYLDRFPDTTDGSEFVAVERARPESEERVAIRVGAGTRETGTRSTEPREPTPDHEDGAGDEPGDSLGTPPSL